MAFAHPTKEHLCGYATGALSDGMSLLVAAHMTYCPDCRAQVERLESLGGALIAEDEAVGEIRPPSVDAALAALDAPAPGDEVINDPGTPLPMPVRRVVGARLDDLDWKFRLPGLSECDLDGFEDEHVSLLRVKPGTGIFHHTHEGEEATLILSGEMQDGDKVYRRGDVALADQGRPHGHASLPSARWPVRGAASSSGTTRARISAAISSTGLRASTTR